MRRLWPPCLALLASGCIVLVVGGPSGVGGDGGPPQTVNLPDGGVGYVLPDGGVAPSLVEPVCSVNPTSGPAGTLITFDGQSSQGSPGATVVAWAWTFGDGSSASGALVQHIYPDGGTFQAVLTATDDSGASGSADCPLVTISP